MKLQTQQDVKKLQYLLPAEVIICISAFTLKARDVLETLSTYFTFEQNDLTDFFLFVNDCLYFWKIFQVHRI